MSSGWAPMARTVFMFSDSSTGGARLAGHRCMSKANSAGLERSLKLLETQGFAERRAVSRGVLKPQLATLGEAAPKGKDWIHETKYDGYRIVAFRDGKKVRLLSRNGLDWTARFPE